MVTLSEHIKTKVPDYDINFPIKFEGGSHFLDIKFLTANIKVIPVDVQHQKKLSSIILSRAEFCYYKELINLIVSYFVENNINNALTLGLVIGETKQDSLFSFKGHNAALNLLFSKPMEAVKVVLGIKEFLELVVNYKCFWIPTNTLLWGDLGLKNTFISSRIPKYISLKPMMQVLEKNISNNNPVPYETEKLFSIMFRSIMATNKGNIAKRFRKVHKILKVLVSNHKAKMFTYPYIFDQICGKTRRQTNNNISLSTEKKAVIEFAMTIIYKVIPLELFGNSKNRVILMRKLTRFLNGTVLQKTKITHLLNGITINDIEWLKPRSNFKMTKPEFLKARQMYLCFVYWLFNSFVCRLIGSFFHVTEASQAIMPIFYRHSIWRKISKRFLSKYFVKHLSIEKDTVNSFESFSGNVDHIGKISLHPKKSSFRLIVKPFKGSFEKKVEYLTYQKKRLRPINKILSTIRYNRCCASLSDIVDEIYTYKKGIKAKYDGSLPKIYCFKFDVKNAYDSLPHELIEKTVKYNLDRFTSKDTIYTHIFSKIRKDGKRGALSYYVTDDLSSLNFPFNLKMEPMKVELDTHETLSFSKSEIISFVKSQYKDTCFHTNGKSYYRKLGVYQGFPLSGTLFNTVYDALTSNFFEALNNDDETKIIRLMDDFLVLSTKEHLVLKMKKLTARCIHEFNFHTNRMKSEFSTTSIIFAGLRIDLEKLVCYKTILEYNNAPISTTSFSRLYKQILRYAVLWTQNRALFDISIDASTVEGAWSNVNSLLRSLLYKFINSHRILRRLDAFNIEKFMVFWRSLIQKLSKFLPLGEIGFNFRHYWQCCLKILAFKGIIHKR